MAGKKCISLQEDNDRRAAIMMRKVSRNKTMEILGVASERLFMNGNQRHDIRNHWFAPSCWTIAVKPATKRLCFSSILSTESKWNFDSLELSSRTGCPTAQASLRSATVKTCLSSSTLTLTLPWLPTCFSSGIVLLLHQGNLLLPTQFFWWKQYTCVVQLVPMSAISGNVWHLLACVSSALVVP